MGLPLTRGQQGPEIADLRARLARWQRASAHEGDATASAGDSRVGGDVLPEGDTFDEAVEAVVRAFQRARNLPADAIVGPETWLALSEVNHRLGDRLLWHSATPMRGDDVLDLQHRLNLLGFDAGNEDGIFGPQVRDAVSEFQVNTGLDVDGIVGAVTLEALHRVHRGHLSAGVSTEVREARRLARMAPRGLTGLQVLVDAAEMPAEARAAVDGQDIPFSIAQRLSGRLAASGGRVSLGRGPGSLPAPSARAATANGLGVDLVVSISLNQSASPQARGAAAYHYGSLRYVSAAGQRLAGALLDGCLRAGLGPDCRPHAMTWTILRETRMPAVVVEPGFASNPDELQMLASPAVQDRLAAELVRGVQRFLRGYGDS